MRYSILRLLDRADHAPWHEGYVLYELSTEYTVIHQISATGIQRRH
jgi:hypothetical protein